MTEKKDKIKCIFFSEFHPTAGPKIVYQFPEEYVTRCYVELILLFFENVTHISGVAAVSV